MSTRLREAPVIHARCGKCAGRPGRETPPGSFSWRGRRRARTLGRLAQAEMAQRAVDPQPRELLLHAVLAEPCAQNVEIDAVEILVLVEAGEHHALDPAFGIAM